MLRQAVIVLNLFKKKTHTQRYQAQPVRGIPKNDDKLGVWSEAFYAVRGKKSLACCLARVLWDVFPAGEIPEYCRAALT